jgi:hypothetical protein
VRYVYPTITEHLALSLVIKAMNDTVGPEGLVPALLVFCISPRLSADGSLPNQHDHMLELDSARREMDTIVSEMRIERAFSGKTFPDAILVYRSRANSNSINSSKSILIRS